MKTINSLVELAQAIEDCRKLERSNRVSWSDDDLSLVAISYARSLIKDGLIRIKEESKIIDMSVAIKSGVDCEFSERRDFHPGSPLWIGALKADCSEDTGPAGAAPYKSKHTGNYDTSGHTYCRIRENHIHYWGGGEFPLPAGLEVKLHYRIGDPVTCTNYVKRNWKSTGNAGCGDIIGFEVLGVADGYVYSKEQSE